MILEFDTLFLDCQVCSMISMFLVIHRCLTMYPPAKKEAFIYVGWLFAPQTRVSLSFSRQWTVTAKFHHWILPLKSSPSSPWQPLNETTHNNVEIKSPYLFVFEMTKVGDPLMLPPIKSSFFKVISWPGCFCLFRQVVFVLPLTRENFLI